MLMKGKDPFSLGPVRLQFATYTQYREHFQLTDYVVKAQTHHCQSPTASIADRINRRPLRSNRWTRRNWEWSSSLFSMTIAARDRRLIHSQLGRLQRPDRSGQRDAVSDRQWCVSAFREVFTGYPCSWDQVCISLKYLSSSPIRNCGDILEMCASNLNSHLLSATCSYILCWWHSTAETIY